ncbi:hypothetical protein CR205_08815 [Alteribacter lacisalsi]|uniref:DUF2624 domain-containing protein n=1 Tax=Alteribacter lacisalsi TaxID=2045244 RepID=A0A2W0HCR8_9BACI|nr:DUF2624 family protein [Alteribacter lacisalsi]PYZ98661.1 hypothetical protein CR205_08815 [Alteribacter lacisalsi]
MNPIVKQMINQKINSLDVKELIRLSRQYQIPITVKQAKQIITVLKKHPIDVGNPNHIKRLQNELKQIDPALYKKAEQILEPYKDHIDWP